MKKLVLVFGMLLSVMLLGSATVKAQGQGPDRVIYKNDQGQWVETTGKNITIREESNATVIDIPNAVNRIIAVPPKDLEGRIKCGGGPGVICGQIYVSISSDGTITTVRCVRPPDNVVCVFTAVGSGGGPGE